MGVKKILKHGFLDGLNPKRILGLESLKQQTRLASDIFKSTFRTNSADVYRPTSFEECLAHYHISEEQLKKRMRKALWTVYFCLVLSIATFAYMFYQFSHHSFTGGLMCITLTLLLWTMAFREHFNWFQMRQRRLGCTITEWARHLF